MVLQYMLSYNGYDYVNGEKVSIYRWVRVQPHQIKGGADAFPTLPELKKGSIVKYRVEEHGPIIFKVLANGQLRELSSDEQDAPGISVRI